MKRAVKTMVFKLGGHQLSEWRKECCLLVMSSLSVTVKVGVSMSTMLILFVILFVRMNLSQRQSVIVWVAVVSLSTKFYVRLKLVGDMRSGIAETNSNTAVFRRLHHSHYE